MKKDLEDEFKLHVTKQKCKRAKSIIMKHMEGSYIDEYKWLEAYCNALRITNPGSDVWVEISKDALEEEEKKRVFRRMYVCFFASKVCICAKFNCVYVVVIIFKLQSWYYLFKYVFAQNLIAFLKIFKL